MSVAAFIPAAGSGKRTGSKTPKQFLKAGGKEILAYTLEVFENNPLVREIVVATHPDSIARVRSIQRTYGISKLRTIVQGGKERQDSVYAALLALPMKPDDLAIVHDAARPLLPQRVLTRAIRHAKVNGSALVALKAGDTLLSMNDAEFAYVDRSSIYYVQTPQIFQYGKLCSAFEHAARNKIAVTDESMAMHAAGYPVSIAEGSLINFKVTTKSDLTLFRQLIQQQPLT